MGLVMIRTGAVEPPPAAGTGRLTVVQATGDVTNWSTLQAPVDDVHGAILAKLQGTPTGWELHSSQYGFTDQDIADELKRLLVGNPASRHVEDRTQESGKAAAPIFLDLKAAAPDQVVKGTSPKAGQILHAKTLSCLSPDHSRGWTLNGSFNLSASAESQFNLVDLIDSPSRALLFAGWVDSIFTWVQQHDPQ